MSEPIRFWKYELRPRVRVGLGQDRPRRGALIRAGMGVADVHPWPELAADYPSKVSTRCGLLTHALYENDPFIERMRSAGPLLIAPEGTGIGFDDLIERLPWERLR